ncbi:MAG: hypothetical protein RLZZ352_2227 [Pseudomonadota bacterium]
MSEAARAFNSQLKRLDKLKQQLQDLDALGRTHQQVWHERMQPLAQQRHQLLRQLVQRVDAGLAGKLLTERQRETACQVVSGLAFQLAQAGDADMAALFERYQTQTVQQAASATEETLREQMEALLREAGVSPDAFDDLTDQPPPRDQPGKKPKKKPNAAQVQAQEELEDAHSLLRKLYRQLASLLHPDREPDAQRRLAKTALMSEANAAYERKDWVALMHIQQRAAVADPVLAAQLSDTQLSALTRLLRQQVAELERERALQQQRWAHSFQLPWQASVTAAGLRQALDEQAEMLQDMLDALAQDCAAVQTDAGLKRWLTRERQAMQRAIRMNPFDFF